ncbi:unnamed protein product [Strongylus vulgaris]|uniref:Methyltransferase small domain-containing protein n=1 Tax=Strongylus vulgaris TaxID=40348 RepID=A0A3P7JVM7_STRVU|nr:unnamed protein product [Strongylus vulgaris]
MYIERVSKFRMKPKRLEWMLSELRGFEKPNIKLEQYETSPELAIAIVDCIDRLVGLDGQLVADLGCGCGMLMSAVALAHEPAAVLGRWVSSNIARSIFN